MLTETFLTVKLSARLRGFGIAINAAVQYLAVLVGREDVEDKSLR